MKYELRKGFTLIELLVVIAIIAILSTVGLTAFTNAQTRGRDAKRQGDIKDMKNAFEQYYANSNSLYPVGCAGVDSATYFQGGRRPTDPKGGAAYVCGSTATAYCVCAALETAGKGNATATNNCGTGGQPTWGTPVAPQIGFQCVVNAQ
jgi:type IV pilus assembly protein PilA